MKFVNFFKYMIPDLKSARKNAKETPDLKLPSLKK